MSFWRPAYELRGAHGYWWNSPLMRQIELSGLACKLFYDHFNVLPVFHDAANDRDGKRW